MRHKEGLVKELKEQMEADRILFKNEITAKQKLKQRIGIVNDSESESESDSESDSDDDDDDEIVETEFTLEELSKYDGKSGDKIYLAVGGIVFDVSNTEFYKPDGPLHIFAGKEATINLIDSSFEDETLNKVDISQEIADKIDFYAMKYTRVGWVKEWKEANEDTTTDILIQQSTIVSNNDNYMDRLAEWMREVGYKLHSRLFRASQNGWSASKFHKCCDDMGATLTIVRASSGRIFGGFTVNPWKSPSFSDNVSENGDKAWLFSLNSTTGHPIRLNYIKGCVQYNGSGCGPVFGGGCDLGMYFIPITSLQFHIVFQLLHCNCSLDLSPI